MRWLRLCHQIYHCELHPDKIARHEEWERHREKRQRKLKKVREHHGINLSE